MKTKIENLNKKIKQFKLEAAKKDKIVSGLKNQNVDLIAMMAELKGEYNQNLHDSKTKLNKLKKEIKKLNAQSSEEANKNIAKLEGNIQSLTSTFHNINNDNIKLM